MAIYTISDGVGPLTVKGTLTVTTGGLTVSSGTAALQAVTATTGNFSSTVAITGKATLNAAGQALLFSGQTTGEQHAQWITSGGNFVVGVEASVAGTSYTNSTAYASVVLSGNTRDLQFGSNSTVYLTLCGGALSGIANSSIGNLFIRSTTAPTGNPTSGGFFWVEAGVLKYRGTSGTVTSIAPA